MSNYDAVFFISFGGPETRDDIMPFLQIVTRGRGIPKERLAEVAHHYEVIGGKSPINEITFRQAEGLKKLLASSASPLPVYVGNRNWYPFLEETLRQMISDGVKRAVGFVTAGYRCEASWERYINAIESARQKMGGQAPVVDYVGPWFDHPQFIEAIAARISECRPPASASWVFTAHSIPTPMAEASRYVQELETTARLVSEKLGQRDWSLAYTSRSGRPRDPWLEPDVCNLIRMQSQRKVREMLLIPIGFVADHVEVLYDLDVEAAEAARETGIRLHRAQTVGDHPLFIRMMVDVITERLRTSPTAPLHL